MSNKVFVDAWAWIALLNESDRQHRQARSIMHNLRQEKRKLLTSEFVLMEVADALSAPHLRVKTIGFINALRQNPILQIISFEQTILDKAWLLYSQRIDKEWGVTDCTSFVIMQDEATQIAFTADHHFVQAGFRKLA